MPPPDETPGDRASPNATIDAFLANHPRQPIILLPVRIETRFRTAGGAVELLVRIYPDTVHVDTHEPALTETEEAWGRTFWEDSWRGGADRSRERLAWTRLADRFGAERSAWIVRALRPRNPAMRPTVQTEAGAPLPVAIDHPPVERRHATQTRAPAASLMPSRWLAIGYGTAGRAFVAAGKPVRSPLAVGLAPDERDEPGEAAEDAERIDEGVRWLVDFDAAVEAGMGLRISLPANVRTGLARLLVVGVRENADAVAAAREFESLLAAQRYTRGASFLAIGTATNNSGEARSGVGAADPRHEEAYSIAMGTRSSVSGDDSAADAFSTAFGITLDETATMEGAGGSADAAMRTTARHVHTVLWPSTLGYYLDQRLRGVVSEAELNGIRSHFIRSVRGLGPLPLLRMGKQPYGVLPTTSLDRWKPSSAPSGAGSPAGGAGARASASLIALRDAFRRALPNVPRVRTAVGDVDRSLVEVLGMSPIAESFAIRSVIGPTVAENLWAFADVALDRRWWDAQQALARSPVAVPGLPALTPQGTSLLGPTTAPWSGEIAPDGATLASLADKTLAQLRAEAMAADANQRSLLERLARHGLMTEYSNAARRLERRADPAAEDPTEPELVDIDTRPSLNVWRRMVRVLPTVTGTQTVAAFLEDPAHANDPALADLVAFRASLRALATTPKESLELACRSALDVLSHRLDAWITSLATQRIEELRSERPLGAIVGGYGWIEGLEPVGTATKQARSSEGYLRGPSLDTATTAALLASGYLSHATDAASPFRIDLSSQRASDARWFLEGVRAGHSLPALVGYRVERTLHEARLDRMIDRLRAMAPLAAREGTDAAPLDVVDGVALLRRWREDSAGFRAATGFSPSDTTLLDARLREVDDLVDALSDLLMAESVFRIARGDPKQATPTLDSIIRGEALPAADVLATPRSGIGLGHRVCAILTTREGRPRPAAAWAATASTPRALAEPVLHGWVGESLGDPAQVRFSIVTSVNGTTARVERSLADLGWGPLDLVAASDESIRDACLATAPASEGAKLVTELDPEDLEATGPETAISLDQCFVLLRSLRRVLARARPLAAADLSLPGEDVASSIDIDELRRRADALVESLRSSAATLANDSTALPQLARFGLTGSVESVLAEANERLARVDAVTRDLPVERELARIAAILGPSFLILPRVRVANAAELQATFGSSASLCAEDRFAIETWSIRMSLVRDGLGRFHDLLRNTSALGRDVGAWSVGQLPHRPGDRWIALPSVPGATVVGRRVAIALHATSDAVASLSSHSIAGLLADEWTESLPSRSETTGVAFHFDEPEARAPQAILLAVPPALDEPWRLETLEATLLETLELAKLRLIDGQAMSELDHLLPAISLATNAANEAIAIGL